MKIRRFRADDVTAVAALYGRAVRIGARHAYPRKALNAWAAPRLSKRFFRNRMLPTWTFVATVPGGAETRKRFRGAGQGGTLGHGGQVVLGFTEIMQDGHVRMLFTDPAATRSGIASRLLAHALNHAHIELGAQILEQLLVLNVVVWLLTQRVLHCEDLINLETLVEILQFVRSIRKHERSCGACHSPRIVLGALGQT